RRENETDSAGNVVIDSTGKASTRTIREIWIDRGGEDWGAYRITEDGWSYEKVPAVWFHRTRYMGALPFVIKGGGLMDDIVKYFGLVGDNFVLTLAAITFMYVCPETGTYPILCIHGEDGAGKTFLSKRIVRIVDPRAKKHELATTPTERKD